MTELKCFMCVQPAIDYNSFGLPVCEQHLHGPKKEELLNSIIEELQSQLYIATDLGAKRWNALNEIYERAEKKNTNWCKRKAAEGLGLKDDEVTK